MVASLVLYSGGLDSFLTLLIAMGKSTKVCPLFFNYGQNSLENERRAVVATCKSLNIDFVEIDISGLTKTFLKSEYTTGIDASKKMDYEAHVPNRNLLFATLASNYAGINGYQYLFMGTYFGNDTPIVGTTIIDSEEYTITTVHPADQGKEFMTTLAALLKLSGISDNPTLVTPLGRYNKVKIIKELHRLGKLQMAIKHTYSCYSVSDKRNYWGRGCGLCGSCRGRKLAYDQAMQTK